MACGRLRVDIACSSCYIGRMACDGIDLDTYRRLRAQARRHARRAQEVDDLVQEVLLIALEQGRERLEDDAWLAGVLRHRAAMQARSAVRRRRRETMAAMDVAGMGPALEEHALEEHAVEEQAVEEHAVSDATIAGPAVVVASDIAPVVAMLMTRLPKAARRVAVLALHGMNPEEIRWVLGISDAAFRQRLSSIRKVIGAWPASLRAEALALAYVRDPARAVDLQFGLVRRALKAALRGDAGRRPGIGTHDADGHLLVLRGRAHKPALRGNE
ncbi:MAG: sigma-70 family RNA polymerase sigma factor [Lysobacteraceae bacterium]|nr:MAG: sigma-70 family RNA polymerase sigma factor [Xanthomonadaceae bacterium]